MRKFSQFSVELGLVKIVFAKVPTTATLRRELVAKLHPTRGDGFQMGETAQQITPPLVKHGRAVFVARFYNDNDSEASLSKLPDHLG
ncbi:MAG: hypothetical protein SNJ72_01830 [Fimbriimonadales bacterium]